jgi:hypothetical protein
LITASEIAALAPQRFSRKVWELYRKGLPDPDDPGRFNSLLREANVLGMNYVEALLYVIERRGSAAESSFF